MSASIAQSLIRSTPLRLSTQSIKSTSCGTKRKLAICGILDESIQPTKKKSSSPPKCPFKIFSDAENTSKPTIQLKLQKHSSKPNTQLKSKKLMVKDKSSFRPLSNRSQNQLNINQNKKYDLGKNARSTTPSGNYSLKNQKSVLAKPKRTVLGDLPISQFPGFCSKASNKKEYEVLERLWIPSTKTKNIFTDKPKAYIYNQIKSQMDQTQSSTALSSRPRNLKKSINIVTSLLTTSIDDDDFKENEVLRAGESTTLSSI